LRAEPAAVRAAYDDAPTTEHRRALDTLIAGRLEKHGLTLRLDAVLYHDQAPRPPEITRAGVDIGGHPGYS
jgi:hypothetical protein